MIWNNVTAGWESWYETALIELMELLWKEVGERW